MAETRTLQQRLDTAAFLLNAKTHFTGSELRTKLEECGIKVEVQDPPKEPTP
jgi:hypothetical protein